MNRRSFLKTTAAGGTLVAVGPGCGNPVSAAPLTRAIVSSNPKVQVAQLNDTVGNAGYGTVSLQVAYYKDLDKVGGAITIYLPVDARDQNRSYEVPPDNTILVVQRGVRDFAAFQSSCPHAGCPLGYSAAALRVECPCHSSRFLAYDNNATRACAGDVDHAPAQSGLKTWSTSFNNGVLTIDLNQPLACNNTFPPLVGTTLTLPLSDFPQLAMAGGSATGQPMGAMDPIVVVRVDATTVVALDARCTHRGCTVAWSPSRRDLECPCHGSAFATDGRVLTAPATSPLKSYGASISGNAIVVNVV